MAIASWAKGLVEDSYDFMIDEYDATKGKVDTLFEVKTKNQGGYDQRTSWIAAGTLEQKTGADDMAVSFTQAMSLDANNNAGGPERGEIGVMICPGHAKLLAEKFKTKEELQAHFQERTRIPLHFIPKERYQRYLRRGTHTFDEGGKVALDRPDQRLIFVAGGLGGYHSCIIPTFGDSYAITRKINLL